MYDCKFAIKNRKVSIVQNKKWSETRKCPLISHVLMLMGETENKVGEQNK
jgi:hypothetical protein